VDKALEGVDVLIQAAATTSGIKDIVTSPYLHVTDNAVMNSYLFRAAHEKAVKHVVFFSCTIMLQSSPKQQSEEDFNQAAEVHPRYFGAGWTKVYLEKMGEFYSRLGRTRFTFIRHSNIYGPHDKFDLERSHVFGATVTKVLTAKENSIDVWGSGEEARDLLYIDDLVEFVSCAIERQTKMYSIYNCGSGIATPVKELVEKIIEISGRQIELRYDLSQPTIPTSLCLNCSKANEELGWQAKTPLKEGIRKTLEWWHRHHGDYPISG
jgi:nucleoside-diphosphate-sugar epimerase